MIEVLERSLWLSLGGMLGANARYWLGTWIQQKSGSEFPWGTLVINVSGSFVLGLFMTLVTERLEPAHASTLRLLVAVGFIGAYTTFSTFEYETLAMLEVGSFIRAAMNVLVSVMFGLIGVWLGAVIGRAIQGYL